jgi:hypothetical protein
MVEWWGRSCWARSQASRWPTLSSSAKQYRKTLNGFRMFQLDKTEEKKPGGITTKKNKHPY